MTKKSMLCFVVGLFALGVAAHAEDIDKILKDGKTVKLRTSAVSIYSIQKVDLSQVTVDSYDDITEARATMTVRLEVEGNVCNADIISSLQLNSFNKHIMILATQTEKSVGGTCLDYSKPSSIEVSFPIYLFTEGPQTKTERYTVTLVDEMTRPVGNKMIQLTLSKKDGLKVSF